MIVVVMSPIPKVRTYSLPGFQIPTVIRAAGGQEPARRDASNLLGTELSGRRLTRACRRGGHRCPRTSARLAITIMSGRRMLPPLLVSRSDRSNSPEYDAVTRSHCSWRGDHRIHARARELAPTADLDPVVAEECP